MYIDFEYENLIKDTNQQIKVFCGHWSHLKERILSTDIDSFTKSLCLEWNFSKIKHSKHSKSDYTGLLQAEEQPNGLGIVGFKDIL